MAIDEQLFTPLEPLGPKVSPSDPAEIAELYIDGFTVHQDVLRDDPTFILGRKGSGKTSLLLGPVGAARDLIVLTESVAYDTMSMIDRRIAEIYRSGVDQAASVWLAAFWHIAIFHTAATLSDEEQASPAYNVRENLERVRSYVAGFDPDPYVPNQADAHLADFLVRVDHDLNGATWRENLNTLLGSVGPPGTPLRVAYRSAREVLDKRPRALAIVIDSLEDLQYRFIDLEHVLRGLFRAVGMNARRSRPTFRVRCCFPTELASQMVKLSTNPAKDFGRQHVIHWRGSELIQLAAQRYRSFLQGHEPQLLTEAIPDAGMIPHRQAQELLQVALPAEGFTNRNGGFEQPIGYLLRHTQLLPRHIIQLLNAILSSAFRGPGGTTRAISHATIRAVVAAQERPIVDDILNAYTAKYPDAVKALEGGLDGCPSRFTVNELDEHYRKNGVRKTVDVHFHEFLAMCIEIGAMGQFMPERTTTLYDFARFQYTFLNPEAKRIDTRGEAQLCLHPLFSGAFGAARSTSPARDGKYIYPYGSVPDELTDEVPS